MANMRVLEKENEALQRRIAELEARLAQPASDSQPGDGLLGESSAWLRSFLDTMNQGVIFQDTRGEILLVNSAAGQILDLSPADLQAGALDGLFARAMREDGSPFMPEANPALQALSTGQPVHNVVFGFPHAQSDEQHWVLLNAVPEFRAGDARPYRVYTTFADLTTQKQAELALKKNEQVLRLFVEHSPAAIAMFDRDMRYIVVSQRYLLDYRLNEQTLEGRSHYDVFPEMDEERINIHKRCLAGAVVKCEEDLLPRLDGSFDWVRYELRPWYQTTGEIGGLIFFSEVITERKRNEAIVYAQRDLARSIGQVRSLEAGLRLCLDTAIPLSGLDSGGIYLINPADGSMSLTVHHGMGPAFIEQVAVCPAESLYTQTVNTGQPFYFSTADSITQVGLYQQEGLQALAIVPVRHQDKILGCLIMVSHSISKVPDHARKTLEALSVEIGNFVVYLRAQNALRESEKRLRMALETTSDGFWIVDADSRFKEVNPAYCAMSGYTRDEFLQLRVSDVEALDDQEKILARIETIQRVGSDRFETRHRRKNGSLFDVEVSVNLFDPATGQVICFCRDITERKIAEQDAAYRQGLLEKVIQLGKKITGITDTEQCLHEIYHGARFGLGFDRIGLFLYDYQTRRVTGIYGTTRTGEIELPHSIDLPINPWFGWGKALQHPLGFSFTESYQNEFHPSETDDMYGVEQHAIVAAWSGDHPVMLIAIDNFLTGRKILPADLEAMQLYAGYVGPALENARLHTDLEKKVSERTTQVMDLYDNAPSGYHSLDAKGRFLQINQTELNWLGYSREEVIGRPVMEFLTTEGQATFQKYFPDFLKRGWINDLEIEFLRKDKTSFYTLVSATAIFDGLGNIVMSRSTVVDITERKRAEKALRASEAQLRVVNNALEKAARMKDEFLASMSHELRTPLSGILGVTEGLQEAVYGPLSERQLKALSTIEASGQHLLELINDILDVSKLEAGMLELQAETFALGQICQTSLQMVKTMAQKKEQKVTFSMTPVDIQLQADPRRIKQILVNLLSNAVKYTPAGGSLGLTVEGLDQEQAVQITVWDQGIGIKTQDLEKIFQPFVQVDSSLAREQTGTGLGLALVRHLVDLHGGRVSVQSTFGEGSRFMITLPWVAPPLSAGITQPDDAPSNVPLVGKTPLSSGPAQDPQDSVKPGAPLVLVVDDNQTNRSIIVEYLLAKEFRVAVAGDAFEFFKQIDYMRPDLVLMDIQMPGMDGLEVIRRLRAHANPRIAQAPIIALTALAMPGDREKCIAAGANAYLSKPVRLQNLTGLISELIQKGENTGLV